MASLDVIRTLTIRARAEGFGPTQAAVTDLGQAYETSARRQLSVGRSLDNLERRFVAGAREAQEFAKVQRQINLITAQNPDLQGRANRVLEEASKQFRVANDNTVKYTNNNRLARHELINLSRQIQDVGVGLASGQAAMTIAIQQGSQIADVFASGSASLGGFARQVVGMLTPMRVLIGVTGLLVAGGALLATTWKNTELQFLSLSERLDLPIAKLHELQVVAATFGIDQPEMFRGFEGLGDRIGEARRETGELFKLFEANNVTVGDLESTLANVADLVRNAANGADRYKIAQMAGLPATAEWVRLLSQGGDALRQAAADAGQFTDTLDPLARKAREFDESWNAAWANFSLRARSAITDAIDLISSLISTAQNFLTQQMLRFRSEADIGRQALGAGAGTQLTSQQADSFYQLTGALKATDAAGKTVIPTMERVGKTVKDAGKEALSALDVLRNNVTALGDAATETEKYELAVAELVAKLQEGTISQDTFNRAVSQLNPTVRAVKDVIGDLGDALAKAFIEGKDAADAFSSALKSIAATNISSTIKGITTGLTGGGFDFQSILTGGLIGVGASLLSRLFGGGDDKAEQEAQAKAAEAAKKALQEATSSLEGFTSKVIALNGAVEQTPLERLEGAQRNFRLALEAAQRVAEVAHQVGGVSVDAAEANAAVANANAQVAEAGRALSQFYASESKRLQEFLTGPTMSESEKKIKEITDAGEALNFVLQQLGYSAEESASIVATQTDVALKRLNDTLVAVSESTVKYQQRIEDAMAAEVRRIDLVPGFPGANIMGDSLARRLSEFDRAARREVEIARKNGEDIVTLEQALAAERVNVMLQFMDEVAQRARALEDRLFATTIDTQTLEGQLAAFDRAASRERLDEAKRGGDNMVLLEQTLAAERQKIIDDFNRQALEAEQQAAEDRIKLINDAAKTIVDYVNSLFAGPQATGSPRSRLMAAQATYEATLAQARAGNLDAVNRITDDAENLRSALRDVYGSTDKYQEGLRQIATELLNLPTVQSSTDQIVNAIRDSIIVLQHIDAALSGTTPTTAGVPPGFESLYAQLTPQQIANLTGVGYLGSSTGIGIGIPTFQRGGWVGGGGGWAHPGEFVVQADAARANADMLSQLNMGSSVNDNVATELRSLRRENALMLTQIARFIAQGNEQNVVAIKQQQRATSSEARIQAERTQSQRRKRANNG